MERCAGLVYPLIRHRQTVYCSQVRVRHCHLGNRASQPPPLYLHTHHLLFLFTCSYIYSAMIVMFAHASLISPSPSLRELPGVSCLSWSGRCRLPPDKTPRVNRRAANDVTLNYGNAYSSAGRMQRGFSPGAAQREALDCALGWILTGPLRDDLCSQIAGPCYRPNLLLSSFPIRA